MHFSREIVTGLVGRGRGEPHIPTEVQDEALPRVPRVMIPALARGVCPCLHQCFLNVHEHLHVPIHPGGILQVKPPPVEGNDSEI